MKRIYKAPTMRRVMLNSEDSVLVTMSISEEVIEGEVGSNQRERQDFSIWDNFEKDE